MEIGDLLRALVRRWPVILATVVAAVAVGYLNLSSAEPVYRSAATVRVFTAVVGDANWTEFDLQYSDRLINTYVAVLTSGAVESALAPGLRGEFPEIDNGSFPGLEVEVVPTTELLSIAAISADPELAAAVANGVADLLVAGGLSAFTPNQLGQPTAIPIEPIPSIAVLQRAGVPSDPVGPGLPVLLALIAIAGLIIGTVIALLLHALDSRLYDVASIAAVAGGVPVIGEIPVMRRGSARNPLRPSSAKAREAARGLYLNVLRSQLGRDVRDEMHGSSLLVVASQPDDGASTVASQLAVVGADDGYRVLLVDMNLRMPAIARLFDLQGLLGLSDTLSGKVRLGAATRRTAMPNLDVLPSGTRGTTGPRLLNSPQFGYLIAEMREAYDLIVIDAPPFPAITDAALIAPHVEGVLLVARCGASIGQRVSEAVLRWKMLSVNVLGVVANCAPSASKALVFGKGYGSGICGTPVPRRKLDGIDKEAQGRHHLMLRGTAEE